MAFVEIIGQQPLIEVSSKEPAEVIITPGSNIRLNVVVDANASVNVSLTTTQGLKGDKGDTGATGAQGPQGIQGIQGPPGANGAPGPNQVTTSTSTNITGILKGNGSTVQQAVAGTDYGTVSSVGFTAGTGIGLSGTNPITGSGNITFTNTAPDQTVSISSGTGISVTGTYPNFTVSNTQTSAQWGNITGTLSSQTDLQNALNAKQDTLVSGTNIKTINSNSLLGSGNVSVGTVTSVGLTMPSAFSVANSPVTGSGTLAVTGAGLADQYIRGDGSLANFPAAVGGGSSVSYYLNGSVNQGTFGGNVYHELSRTPIIGAGTNFTIGANGYIAQFITDAGDPALLNIPGGNWDFQMYFSASSSGGSPQFYTELYKYDGTNFTLISSGSTSPQNISFGTFADVYSSTLTIPQTALAITDRLAVRIYVIHSGRTITLYTEDNKLAEIHTTFSTGLAALNGLTAQVQYLGTGTTGTDFNISSVTDTHTFNLPVASATNTGKLSSTDWSTFNNKPTVYYQNTAPTGTGTSSIILESMWTHSDTGIQYTYIYDGNTYQWVQATLPLGPQGPQGPSGTNTINASTATTFNGLLKGNGATISATTVLTEIGYTPENQANKENTTLDTSATKYPTNNLVKTSLDAFSDDVDYAIMTNQRLLFNF